MRHRKKGKTLDRNSASRKALVRGLAVSLVLYEKMKTTQGRVKVIRPFVERLVTRAKENTLANRRHLLSLVPHEMVVRKLLEVLGPRYKSRKGGYTRIVKLMPRKGDQAQMAQIEFV